MWWLMNWLIQVSMKIVVDIGKIVFKGSCVSIISIIVDMVSMFIVKGGDSCRYQVSVVVVISRVMVGDMIQYSFSSENMMVGMQMQ